MGKKGKGKGNRLAKMSEEERVRYLQLRADIEEENRRRKIQLISMYMKNKLKREEAFCRLNMAKINQEWRSILRQVKCEELRKEIIAMEKYCRDMMDHKDNVIRRLLNDLEVAHNQHDNLSQSHMEMVQRFIDIQQQRLEFFGENYETEKQLMLQEFKQDHQIMNDFRNKGQENLECIYYQLEEKNDKEKNEAYEKFLGQLDDIKATMQLRIENITEKGEQKLEKLWHDYQQALTDYVQHTEGFYADYMDLKEKDEEYNSQNREYAYEVERASNQLASLKLTLAEAEDKSEVKLKHLQLLKEHLTEKLNELKVSVKREMRETKEKFKLATVESYKAVKNYQTISEKGNTILQLAAVCRKFETEKEKILPLGLPPLTKLMFANAEEEQQYHDFFRQQEREGCGNWFLMEDFWKRVNNVKMDVLCLTQRKRSLEKENQRLKAELQERLIKLNISNGINNHINDYLAKRPSSMRMDRVERLDLDQRLKCQSADVNVGRRSLRNYHCITEANLSNAVRSRLMAKGKPKLAKIVAIKH